MSNNIKNVKNANVKSATVNDNNDNNKTNNNNNNNNNDEVDKMKNNTNNTTAKNDINYYGPTPVYHQDMTNLLNRIIKKHEKIEDINKQLQAIKTDYKPYKKEYIQLKKDVQYNKKITNVDFIIEYPDIAINQDGILDVVKRTRTLLFTEWYNNHFKSDNIDSNNKPILKNKDLVSLQSKIFLRLSEEVKNKDTEDIIISKSDLRREGQRLFKCIIDDGEGRWGNIQVKYCLATIAQQDSKAKQAREVHKELFSKILFTAFAEGEFISRPQKVK